VIKDIVVDSVTNYERDIREIEIDFSTGVEVEVVLPSNYNESLRITLTRDFVTNLYNGFLENDYPPASTGFDQETDKQLYGMFVYQEQVSGGNPDPDVVEVFLNERGYQGQEFINYAYSYIDELDSKYHGSIADPGDKLATRVLEGNFEYPEFKDKWDFRKEC